MISFQATLPLLIFFVVTFLAFYFVETVLLLALNFCVHKYAIFVVDKLLWAIAGYRTLMRIAAFGVISLIIVVLFHWTSLADLLVAGTGVLRFLALILVTTMLIIYYIGSRSLSEILIVKRIHLFIYIILSLFAFTGIMSVARDGYVIYQDAINQAFVAPIVENIEYQYHEKLEDRLLNVFRQKVRRGECEYYDFADKQGAGVTQFIYIKTDQTLAEENPEIRAKGLPLAGRSCVLQTKFLLTPEGKWYEVLEQDLE